MDTNKAHGGRMHEATQEQIERGRGLQRKDMTPEERRLHDNQLQRRRARQYRKRKAARQEADTKERATTLEPEHLRAAMDVTALLSEKIDLVSTRRARKAARLVGSIAEDACFETFAATNRSIAGAIERGERERAELLVAAEWLAHQPGIPDVDPRDEQTPVHAGWLMAVIEYRSRTAIQSWYQRDASLEGLADTLAASSGSDDFYDNFHANRQPQIMGARWPQPGQIDPGIIQGILAGAITAKGLDALVEVVLANLRSDGSFSWTEHAEQVFLALDLQMHWHLLCRKAASPELRGRYARGVARRAVSFLLPVMEQATTMIDEGVWVAPDPVRLTLAVDPSEMIRALATIG